MATPTPESRFSSFQNVFPSLPQGHDKALKQAFYNTAATLFAVIVCCVGIAVYYILEAFLRPLLWAVLCGAFLHPFKKSLTSVVQGWLKNLRTSGTPLALGAALLPIRFMDLLAETLGHLLSSQYKIILSFSIGMPAVYILYHFGPMRQILTGIQSIFYFVYDALGYFSATWVWTLVLAYVLVVAFCWTPQSSRWLRHLAVPVWGAVLFHFASIAGPLRVPILMATVALVIVGFVAEVNQARRNLPELDETIPDRDCSILSPSVVATIRVFTSANTSRSEPPSADSSLNESVKQSSEENPSSLLTPDNKVASESAERVVRVKELSPEETPKQATTQTAEVEEDEPDGRGTRPPKLIIKNPGDTQTKDPPSPQHATKSRSLSESCFIGLISALILVHLWKSVLVIQLLPILFVFMVVKKIGVQVGSWRLVRDKVSHLGKAWKENICNDARIDIVAPKPVRGLGKLILRGDKKVISAIEKSMNQVISVLIILLLMVGMVLITFICAVQVHRESMHLVSVTSNVLNNSLHPELSQWLPDGDVMHKALDSMVSNAYLYGRDWLTTKVNHAFNGDKNNMMEVEKQVLEIWDQLYESWFAKNSTAHTQSSIATKGPVMPVSFTNLSGMMDMVRNADSVLSLNIVSWVQDNIGVLRSILESVWLVLKGNINLVLSLLTATLSILLGGGTALLNFFLSTVVFLTSLFYLLAFSGAQYKPLEWCMSMGPAQGGSGNRFGKAVEEAIGSVFAASLKMAAFYGLYTWLTHTVFGINIVFIPSALASVFAMIPFMGTYWAALPAIIELWLVKGELVQAVMLLVAHFIPTYFVDTAIYSEIKGGHPYLTGLAIAGGIYWMGLEGAIIAPILLCCLIVAMNMYSSMLQPDLTAKSSSLSAEKKVQFRLNRAISVPWQ